MRTELLNSILEFLTTLVKAIFMKDPAKKEKENFTKKMEAAMLSQSGMSAGDRGDFGVAYSDLESSYRLYSAVGDVVKMRQVEMQLGRLDSLLNKGGENWGVTQARINSRYTPDVAPEEIYTQKTKPIPQLPPPQTRG